MTRELNAGALLTTLSAIRSPSVFAWVITAWLWLTAVFANLAEAVAEGRGRAQAETLRRTKTTVTARRLTGWRPGATEAGPVSSRKDARIAATRIATLLACKGGLPDPAQRGRLAEMRDNLHDRITEAEREGWLGEIEGLLPAGA